MIYPTKKEAFCLAKMYSFCPPHAVYPSRIRLINDGKYEFDYHIETGTHQLILAHYADKTNIMTEYNPELCFLFSYKVTGTLNPNAAGNYAAESGWPYYRRDEGGYYCGKFTYVHKNRIYLIWWDGTSKWIISDSVGWKEGKYWSRTDPNILGAYTPQGGATGTATVAAAPAADYNVSGSTTPVAWGNYYVEGTYEEKSYHRRVDGLFFIWWDGIDSWIISYCPGYTNRPYWKRTDPSIGGEYEHYGGADGIATVAAGEI